MYNIAIFASGSGTNAENIARIFNEGNKVRVSLVVTNRAKAGVIERMSPLGVETVVVPNSVWDSDPAEIVALLRSRNIDLVVLAGFMHYVDPVIINAFPGRVINIHPSLLPAYGGKGMWGHHVHEAVVRDGQTRSGVTVHYVTPEVDGGEIIMQQEVAVTPEDTAETLEAKIHPVEYELYPRAIAAVVRRLDAEAADPSPASSEIPEIPSGSVPPPLSVAEDWAKTLQIKNVPPQLLETPENEVRQAKPEGPEPPAVKPLPESGDSMPPTFLLWSILVMLLCCTPAGIVAVIYAASVSSKWYQGDHEGARKASRMAEIWILVSFCIGVLSATLYIPWLLVS